MKCNRLQYNKQSVDVLMNIFIESFNIMKKLAITGILFFCVITAALCQSKENYDLELYGHWVTNSKNSDASFQAHNLDAKLFTKTLSKDNRNILMLRAKFSHINIHFDNYQELSSQIGTFYSAGTMLAYTKIFDNPKWRFSGVINPQLNSDFSNGFSFDDLYLNLAAIFHYRKQRNSMFSFGLSYASTFGFPAPIPYLNYWRLWDNKWELNLGIPRTSISRHINTKTKLVAFSEFQGYNGNIGESIQHQMFKKDRIAQKISYSDFVAGLELLYKIKESILLKYYASYTIKREFEIQDSDYNTAYSFEMGNNFNIGVGLSFNF